MAPCPNDADLAGFLNDLLTGERLARVSGHVDSCADCQARLDRLTDQSAARLKQLPPEVVPQAARTARPGVAPDTQILGAKPAAVVPPGLPRVRGFEVLAEIGRGGMGVVYRARHLRLNRLVALKMILAGAAADARVVQRFLFEAEFLAKIQHPQVVQVYEIDMFQGPTGVPVPYLAMELLEGGSLHRRLRDGAAPESGGAPRWPTPRAAAELVEGIARAVHAAHLQGVIHRDLKPGNILFPGDRGQGTGVREERGKSALTPHPSPLTPLPKVMDFGLAKFTQDAGADLTQTGQIVGTPHYMAPEQAAGGRAAAPTVDVYALGAILYECLAGRPPFVGAEPLSVLMQAVNDLPADVRALRPDLPRDLAAVTMKCLEKDPARRYPTAEALARDLRRFLDDHPTRARPVRATGRAWLWAKRNPVVAGLCAALAAVLVAAFVTVGALWLQAERTAADERAARADAEREGKKAEAALNEALRRKALLEFRRGTAACEETRVEEGLASFLLAAQLAEQTGDAELARVARVNLAAWPRDLAPPPRAFAHRAQPRLAAFHPDGKHLATAGRGDEVYLWDIASGARVKTFKPPFRFLTGTRDLAGVFWTVAVSPDGKLLAAGGTDKAVTLWRIDPTDRREVIPHAGVIDLGAEVWSLGFTPDGALWCSDPKGLAKLDVADPERPRVARRAKPKPGRDGEKLVQILTVGPDGTRIYTGDRAGRVREWDAATAAELRTWEFRDWITDVAVSADGARLAATGPDSTVWVINLKTGEQEYALRLAGAFGDGVAFTAKSHFLVATDGDGNVRFWRGETGQPVGVPLRFKGEVTRPRPRPGTDEFAVPAGDTVFVARAPDPPGDPASAGHGLRVRGLGFAANGRVLVADDEHIELLAPLDRRGPVALPKGRKPLSVCGDPDPARPFVYVGTRDGFERIAADGTKRPEPVESSLALANVHAIACLPGAGRLYARGNKVVARFDPTTLARLAERKPVPDIPGGVELGALAVRPDGGEVLVTVADRVVFLHPDTLDFLREWPAPDEVLSACYTPDGSKVLLGRRDNAAELRDAATGRPIGAPMAHARAVTSVAVGRGGALLLTGSRDGTARFWDAATGLPMGAPLRHAAEVTCVAFAADGDHAATGTGGGHVSLWDLPPAPAPGTTDELRAKLGLK